MSGLWGIHGAFHHLGWVVVVVYRSVGDQGGTRRYACMGNYLEELSWKAFHQILFWTRVIFDIYSVIFMDGLFCRSSAGSLVQTNGKPRLNSEGKNGGTCQ
jgi:hypothetical protein